MRDKTLTAVVALAVILTVAWHADAVLVGRVDVTPSGGSTDENPVARIVAATPGANLFVSSGNRGDWDLGWASGATIPAGRPFLQADGVMMVTVNERPPQERRGGAEAPGELTVKQGNASNGGIWIAGFTAAGNGAEANRDVAFAYFPFAEGWMGLHVAADGETVRAKGKLHGDPRLRLLQQGDRAGEVVLGLPGIDALEDGMLFAVGAGNGDNVTAVGPLADGSAWHVRVADESHNFRREERGPFSALFLPYATPGLTGGWIADDGSVRRGTGEFVVNHVDTGRYELIFPGLNDSDGILLLQVSKLNPKGVEDNVLAWTYEADAGDGRGAFVVESYDQPGFNLQDVAFYVAFVPYNGWDTATVLDVAGHTPAPGWAEAVEQGQQAVAEETRLAPGSRTWQSPVMKTAMSPLAVSFPVKGLDRLWLSVDTVADTKGASAVWVEPRFRLASGQTVALGEVPWIYAPPEAEEARIGGDPPERAIRMRGGSVIGVQIPDGALAFNTSVAVPELDNADAAVQFRISDRPHRRSAWHDRVWPGLRTAFPSVSARLMQDSLRCSGSRQPEAADVVALMQDGLALMRKDLGALSKRLPEAGQSTRSTAAAYAAAVQLSARVAEVAESLWSRVPALALVLDYPDWTLERLRRKLLKASDLSEGSAALALARLALIDAFPDIHAAALATLLEGDADGEALTNLTRLTKRLLEAESWADAHIGWTTYGGDNRRSHVSRETLPAELLRQWTHRPSLPPSPAWPPPREDNPSVSQHLSPTLTYDRAYHVAVSSGRLYFGSSSADAVVCLSTASGEELWRHRTGAPVRTTPAIGYGRVFAGSDDGYVTCLDAVTGREVWRYRPAGEDSRLAGNGRIMSAAPVRCGVCVDQGTVYVGAGLFPSLGTWLCAIDAQTGEEMWRVSAGVTLQGHMLLSPERIFVPTGRTPFSMFKRSDGTPLGSLGRSDSWGKDLPGGCCALVVNETIVTGPGEGGSLHAFDTQTREAVVKTPGRRLIVDGRVAYILTESDVRAVQRRPYLKGETPRDVWQTACEQAYSMIKVGEDLLLGGDGRVVRMDARSGDIVGTLSVQGGRAEGLAFSGGRLFVSMGDGGIHCFGANSPPPPGSVTATHASIPPSQEGAAEQPPSPGALSLTTWYGKRPGYALLTGQASLDAAVPLSARSGCSVVVAGRSAQVTQLRSQFGALDLPGKAVSVHAFDAPSLPYRPYLFNIVVADDPSVEADEWFRVTRPCGGRLIVRGGAVSPPEQLRGQFEAIEPPVGWDDAVAYRRGPLPGSGAWTHGYADPGNTACSGDSIPFGPASVLWFGRPGPRFMLERHIKGAPPLYQNGLLYVTGNDYLAGLDAYNGAILWEKHVPGSGRMGMLKDCGNMTAADGRLYVAADACCLVLAGVDGQTVASYEVPGDGHGPRHWGYLAAWRNLLVGSAILPQAELQPGNKADYSTVWYHHKPVVTSLELFAVGRSEGDVRWVYAPSAGVIANPSITIASGLVCFVESTTSDTRQDEDGKVTLAALGQGGARLTALQAETGELAWSVPFDLQGFEHALYMAGAQGVLVLTGTRHDVVDGKKLIQYRLVGVDARTGREIWRSDSTPTRAHILDGGHGEQVQHPAIVGSRIYGPGFVRDLATGARVDAWEWNKSPQCATLSASKHCAFSRQGGRPTMAAFETGKQLTLTKATRPGCWINTLPVGGIVLIPEASSGCTCGYSVQTSLALYPVAPK